MSVEPVKTGIIGCGNISNIYLTNAGKLQPLELVGVADLLADRAKDKAEQFGCRAMSVDEMLGDDEIELIINLTIPKAHYEVAMDAIGAGKHVYNEKPLALSDELGAKMLAAADDKGVLIGGAPDTFLGAGLQTCRQLIDEGAIGEPVAATAFLLCRGHETWHPDPEFYYKAGGGPMLDMGPYYLTALVSLLGPIRRVTGCSRASFPTRTITSKPKNGQKIDVETDTHIAGVFDFAAGPIGTIITSFDVGAHNLPRVEIYGSAGTLSVPDPNTFAGPVRLRKLGGEWEEIPVRRPYAENSRGLGPADLACAARTGRDARASGALCQHVLEAMLAVTRASAGGKHIELTTTTERPAPLPADLTEGELPD